GVTASFGTNPVTPPANSSATSTLTLTASGTATTGTVNVTVSGVNGGTTHTANISLTVNPAGVPALTATYNATYKAPSCGSGGKSCTTGSGSASIIYSRGTLSPAEANAPNTINSSCADGNTGTFHSD